MGHTGHLGCSDFGFALREPGSRGDFAPGSGLSVSGSSESGENSNSERISKVETIRSLRA